MIKAKSEQGRVEIKLNGKLNEIIADLMCIVQGIYKGLNDDSPKTAEEFKKGVLDTIKDAFEPESAKGKPRLAAYSIKELKELMESLKELIDNED